MTNIKSIRGGKKNRVRISWYEDPNWPDDRKNIERKAQESQLLDMESQLCDVERDG